MCVCEALTNSKSSIESKLIEESQADQCKKYSVLKLYRTVARKNLYLLWFMIWQFDDVTT